MPTLDGLIDSVIRELHGQTNSQEQLATLLGSITDTAGSLQIDNTAAGGLGMYEIDEEVLYVSSAAPDGTLTVPAWGRGQLGTVPAYHNDGAKVTCAPRFPRQSVKDMIAEAIQQLYPALYGIATTEFLASWVTPQYEVPAVCARVLAVEYKLQGSNQQWIGVRRWRLDDQAPSYQFPSGKSLGIADLPYPGTEVRVTYATEPVPLVFGYDDFTLTGFRASVADLVRLTVVARLVVGPETARGQIGSAEQSERSVLVTTGSTTSVARYYQTLLAAKLRTEQQALYAQVPVRVVRTWT